MSQEFLCKNLNYGRNSIHRRYNQWVMKLETAIKEEVARVTPPP